MIATQYTVRDSKTERTDIDIMPAVSLNMFRQTHRRTDLSHLGALNDWLMQTVSWFDVTFTPERNAITFLYFSTADALTSKLRFPEAIYAAVIESALAPLSIPSDIPDWPPDAASLPRQLAAWLGITYDQLSNITGISRAAFFYWRRPGTKPRPENAWRVQQLFALTSLLVKRLGVRGAQAWLHSESTHAWDLLLAGDLAGLEHLIRTSMFPTRAVIATPNKLPLDEVSPPLAAAPLRPDEEPRRARRAPTRRRLGSE